MSKDEDETFRKLSQRPFEEVMDSLGPYCPYVIDEIDGVNKFNLPMCDKFKELGWTAKEVNNELNQRMPLPQRKPKRFYEVCIIDWIKNKWRKFMNNL